MTGYDARAAEIRGRMEAASPGPWVRDIGSPWLEDDDEIYSVETTGRVATGRGEERDEKLANAELIAHAPDDLTFLLTERDQLTAELRETGIQRDAIRDTLLNIAYDGRAVAELEFDDEGLPGLTFANSSVAGWRDTLEAELTTLLATLERVRALHAPYRAHDTGAMVSRCMEDEKFFPCPTIRALDASEASDGSS